MGRVGRVCLLAAAALAACGGGDPGTGTTEAALRGGGGPHRDVTVMTQNLYLGGDILRILAVQDPAQLPAAVGALWTMVQSTDFPERAHAIAAEIAATRPDVVGLQEVALWRVDPSGDACAGAPPDATEVAYDFLAILTADLEALGMRYRPAASVQNFDGELCTLVDGQPMDVRYTDRDVILASDEVSTAHPAGANYAVGVPVTVGPITLTIPRGWVATDVKLRGQWFRFVSTHLEVVPDPGTPGREQLALVQAAQAAELLQVVAAEPLATVVVGDFNSPAPVPPGAVQQPTTPAYGIVTGAGLSDAWLAVDPGDPGFTDGQAEDLRNATSTLDARIDLVLTRGAITATGAWRVGAIEADRTPSGLWPSDHAGVVADLQLAVPTVRP